MSRKQKKKKAKVSTNRSWQKAPILIVSLILIGATVLASWYLNPSAPSLPEPPLRDLAQAHDIELGMLANPKRLGVNPYTQILTSQYSFITSDGELHWDKFRPSPNEYNYQAMDKLVSFAKENDMSVQAHHLVWNEEDSLPGWLKTGQYSQQQLMDIMHDHISTTVGHYKGEVKEWTVVNEPFSRAQHIYGLDDWWGDHLGDSTSYIDNAFKWAHEADPAAKLILNDFYNETATSVSDAEYNYLQAAKAKGVPIDGIGMQMHIDVTRPPSRADLIKNMQRYRDLGYPVYITEFNVHSELYKGTASAKAKLEAQVTHDVVRACVESRNCVSFNVFGQTETHSLVQWITRHKTPSHLFNSRYQPKPAYYAFHEAWQQP